MSERRKHEMNKIFNHSAICHAKTFECDTVRLYIVCAVCVYVALMRGAFDFLVGNKNRRRLFFFVLFAATTTAAAVAAKLHEYLMLLSFEMYAISNHIP